MRPKTHVVVLMGGMSSEYEISLKSGKQVMDNLDRGKYKVSRVHIRRNGEWEFEGDHEHEFMEIHDAVPRLKALHPDCVFIALHGPYGEDGRIQGMLDLLGIPYTGSGCAASAIAIDKTRSKAIVEHGGIPVAEQIEFNLRHWDRDPEAVRASVEAAIGFPCVVKSPRQGSSLGMGIVHDPNDFAGAVNNVLTFGYRCMVERYIDGVELTCGVLDVDEDAGPIALPVTEIRPTGTKFFDYERKYTPGATEEITPAGIPDEVREKVQEMSVRAHELIGCRGFSRSDMILEGDGAVWLEINTIPGLTETSLYPQAAVAAGISFPDLLSRLVDSSTI